MNELSSNSMKYNVVMNKYSILIRKNSNDSAVFKTITVNAESPHSAMLKIPTGWSCNYEDVELIEDDEQKGEA